MEQRHRMKKNLSLVCIFFLGSMSSLYAQDIEKEFSDFEKEQQQEFDEFKNKADAEFETFLRETWKKYDAFAPIPAPVRPEPSQPVVFDKTKPALPPVTIRSKRPVRLVRKPDVPAPVQMPLVMSGKCEHRTSITFYGTKFDVATDVVSDLVLTGDKEDDIADAWKQLCQKDYTSLIGDCIAAKNSGKLNDWAYLLFTNRIGKHLYGERANDIAFLQMFLLNKSGYKVRLGKMGGVLKLMVATAGTMYGLPYLKMEDGDRYYVFAPDSQGSNSIYTYRRNFANAKNLVCLDIESAPEFSAEEHERMFILADSTLNLRTVVNKNLIDFYRDYPQCDVEIHYRTPMSEKLRASLYPNLRKAIEGMSQGEAADFLLYFVQKGFRYKTDGEQFGYEKPNFPDETFYYPYCDCEDRAMLYAVLVKDLMGLEAVLLDYPNHIAAAVRFTEKISGDSILLEDGTEYLICDPTYIGAPIGTCMKNYKNVVPKVIY